MASLKRELRKELEQAVTAARSAAEIGARKAIEALAVQNGKPWPSMTEEQKQLRNRLRAHGRQLGDRRELRSGSQSIDHITQECAYEHWHRMLFARFLAESDLLIEPESGVAISLDECRELALERGVDWLTLASEFAVKMLSQIFRAGDPVLEILLPPETRQELEGLMKSLPREVFLADDSLGWVYQFWQAEKKNEVNASGEKIGADGLAPVTQLFTEDYMVLFLLHNTLGAWWAGKVLAQQPDLAKSATSEEDLRAACAVVDVSWEYLRFVREGEGPWRPASGTFNGWPKDAKHLKVLDPCMGSGHFLVFALPMLVALRMAEDKLSREDAIEAVLRDNLFGLELDNRCTQIAAFNLALTAWRIIGHRQLPALNLACSGLGINAKEEEWVELAGKDQRLRDGMSELYRLFRKGPVLGSLINPLALNKPSPLLIADFQAIQPFLEAALRREDYRDYETTEMTIAAQGMAKAAEILAGQFTLVATNVPYLKNGKHDSLLKEFCERTYPKAKADLATVFVERCIQFGKEGGSAALVTPQTWLFLGSYTKFRTELLADEQWNFLARLGPGAFETISGEVVNVALLTVSREVPPPEHSIAALDANPAQTSAQKADLLREAKVHEIWQASQLKNPDARISLGEVGDASLLQVFSDAYIGQRTGDGPRFILCSWELPALHNGWVPFGTTVEQTSYYGGLHQVLLWEDGKGQLADYQARLAETVYASGGWKQGWQAWGKGGVRVSQMGGLPVTLHTGSHFDNNCAVIVPQNADYLPAIWAFCESPQFKLSIRLIDQSIKVTNATLTKVPFDLAHWQKVAAEKYPHGLPTPFSSDPTQWLFNGHPKVSDEALHVAVARLVDYQWPRQTGSTFPDCPPLELDGLEKLADADGIVCLDALQGELSAADRLRALLAAAYGTEWSPAKQAELLAQVEATSLDQWLREEFFLQHCALFHNRPFIWHIWDGMKNGFHALVNYHKLAAPNSEGRRTLERLIYSYLGDWIKQQREDQKNGVDGADGRVAAAEYLKKQLELILHGEPPYDIFVRWKSLPQQPIGWEPDINDGVRLNIRPFITATPLNARGSKASVLRVTPKNIEKDKDRGKEPHREKQDFPWFWTWDQSGTVDFTGGQKFDGNRWNDLHYSTSFKLAARDRNSVNKKKVKP
jgi:hypothetical protein